MAIKVLLVDDSPTARQSLVQIIDSASDMQVIGQATNGLQAVQMVKDLRPDVVLMDVVMPRMDGIEATREIMDVKPTPIVVISGGPSEANLAFKAMSAGALSVLQKPASYGSPNHQASVNELLGALRSMSGVRVIRHPKITRAPILDPVLSGGTAAPPPAVLIAQPELVAIAVSTGGPQTLAEIIKNLPRKFKLPIVIVQHIAPDFVNSLVDWLNTLSPLPVCVAPIGEPPRPGTIYIAPGKQHLQLRVDHRFGVTGVPSNVPHIPSGDVLLESVAQHYRARAIGIVLTGMGADGARGLRSMYDAGAMTIAQNEATCIVFGMPQEAIALGAARLTLPPHDIAKFLSQYSD